MTVSGHINRMALNAIPRVVMRWTPAGKRKRGCLKLTWRKSVEKEMRGLLVGPGAKFNAGHLTGSIFLRW